YYFFFSSRRRHTRSKRDWSSDVCSSDLPRRMEQPGALWRTQLVSRLFTARRSRKGSASTAGRGLAGRSISKGKPSAMPPLRKSRSEERRVGKGCRIGEETSVDWKNDIEV